jgi:hypothetical protein
MSNNKQQTAVEWYAKEHKKFREEPWKYVNSGGEEAILKQAKEMEKEYYTEFEVLQLLLKLQQTESYDNLYDWFEENKKNIRR